MCLLPQIGQQSIFLKSDIDCLDSSSKKKISSIRQLKTRESLKANSIEGL